MIKKGQSLSTELIGVWPEILGEVEMNVLPLRYLQSVLISFKDGKIWEIEIDADTREADWESFESSFVELVTEYEQVIESIDFKLDIDRIKTDIKSKTTTFLKNTDLE